MTLTRKKPMQRSAFKTADKATTLRRAEIKRRIKKPTVAEGSKYLAACRMEECYLRISGICQAFGWGNELVVPAHRNEGKGQGLKVPNIFTLPACNACHMEYDQGRRFTREEKREMWNNGYAEWEPVRNRKMGLVEQPEMEAA